MNCENGHGVLTPNAKWRSQIVPQSIADSVSDLAGEEPPISGAPKQTIVDLDCRLPREDQSTASLGRLNENGCWLQTKAAPRAPFLSNKAKKYVEQPTWPTIIGVFWR